MSEADKHQPSAGASLSARAVVCTAHLMILQNPKAVLHTNDWGYYLALVRDWCAAFEVSSVKVYWHAAMTEPGKLN